MTDLDKKREQRKVLLSVSVNDNCDYHAEIQSKEHLTSCSYKKIREEPARYLIKKKIQKLLFKMYFVVKEVVIMLFLVLAYTALTNDSSKVSKSPIAFPFFPKSAFVKDWFNGELSLAIEEARKSDIAFVMFYAPWDAESQIVRREFALTAEYMQKHVAFAAVNCWQPGSECRRQYNKAFNWPILIVYLPHGNGIQYKGPRTAHYMVKFLLSLSRPLMRLSREAEVHHLLGSYEAVVLGCVNASPGNWEYSVLYSTALRFLEKDPFREIGFAVLTGSRNGCIDDYSSPKLLLYMWNETLIYPTDDEWKPDALLSWIFNSIHQASSWVTPAGTKSLSLNSYIHPGPTMILFTPRNPLLISVDYYDLLREIAMEYYNCNQERGINSLLIHTKRLENFLKYTYRKQTCTYNLESKEYDDYFPSPSFLNNWANNTKCKTSKSKSTYRGESTYHQFYETTILDSYDFKSSENLQKLWKIESCRLDHISEEMYPPLFTVATTTTTTTEKLSILGLSCETNASLTFVALDSLRYYQFAERLGINVGNRNHKTAAVIINQKMELHHIMRGSVNDLSLRQFIYNFSVGSLSRSLNSLQTIVHPQTHSYHERRYCNRTSELCLAELNSKTFIPMVLQEDKAVMVLYYSKQCSFCNGISYVFLTVAKIFSTFKCLLFSRIDGDLNILPWEFTMDSYPTLILFPAKRKSESRVYPKNVPITVANLVNFILSNVEANIKIHAMWSVCNNTKFDDKRQACVAAVRAENLSVIDNTLRLWRKADLLTKTKLLYKLQKLRNINLLLSHLPQNTKVIEKLMLKLHSPSLMELGESDRQQIENHAKDEL